MKVLNKITITIWRFYASMVQGCLYRNEVCAEKVLFHFDVLLDLRTAVSFWNENMKRMKIKKKLVKYRLIFTKKMTEQACIKLYEKSHYLSITLKIKTITPFQLNREIIIPYANKWTLSHVNIFWTHAYFLLK